MLYECWEMREKSVGKLTAFFNLTTAKLRTESSLFILILSGA